MSNNITINGVSFDLRNPVNKRWYSKHKTYLLKNPNYFVSIIDDINNKRKVQYTAKYYACVKFILATTNIKIKKINNYRYYVEHLNEDFTDLFWIDEPTDFPQRQYKWRKRYEKYGKTGKLIEKFGKYYLYRLNKPFTICWM